MRGEDDEESAFDFGWHSAFSAAFKLSREEPALAAEGQRLYGAPYPAIIGTAASAANIPTVRARLKCSCKKILANNTVTAG